MRVSELASTTGVSIATIKLYIREGLLPRGDATAATQANYTHEHVERVKLITSLRSIQGLPLAKLREILAIIDTPSPDPVAATGRAVAALPPYPEVPDSLAENAAGTRELIESLGLAFDPDYPATRQLHHALTALSSAGLATDAETIKRYYGPLEAIARAELEPLSAMSTQESAIYAALGTALYEPLILALRRLLHYHLLTNP